MLPRHQQLLEVLLPGHKIARVEYRRAHMRYGTYAWGKLMVAVRDGREISCNYVADVEQAHNRLIDLMREYAAKEAE